MWVVTLSSSRSVRDINHQLGGCMVILMVKNEEMIKKYIREQETADIALDKLSVKEYEDTFRGIENG